MIAVVGGGITGLALGHELARRGIPFRVLEASNRAGGVIRSVRVEGRVLDTGPQRLRLTPAVRALIEELDLAHEVITAPESLPLFVLHDGRLGRVPFSVGELLSTPLLTLPGRLRILLEPLTGTPRSEETVGGCLRRKLGREGYERVAGPLFGGLYGSDPDTMPVDRTLRPMLDRLEVGRSLVWPLVRRGRIRPPPALSFRDGMEALPRALADRLDDRLSLGESVRSLRRSGDGWVLETAAGGRIEAAEVVLTLPAPAAADLLAAAAPDLAARAAALTYNPLAVVHLLSDTTLRGLGFQCSVAERGPLRGVTFNDSLFARRGLYTAYLGGAGHESVVIEEDDTVRTLAEEAFREATGLASRAVAVTRTAMPAWDRSWSALDGMRLPDGLHLATAWTGRAGVQGRLTDAARLAHSLGRGGASMPGSATPPEARPGSGAPTPPSGA